MSTHNRERAMASMRYLFYPIIPSPTSHHCPIVVKLSRHRFIDSNLDKVIITMYLQGPIWIPRITHTYEFSGKFSGRGSKNFSQILGTNKHVWNPLPSPSRLYLKKLFCSFFPIVVITRSPCASSLTRETAQQKFLRGRCKCEKFSMTTTPKMTSTENIIKYKSGKSGLGKFIL